MNGNKTIGKLFALLLALSLLLCCLPAAAEDGASGEKAEGEGILNGLQLETVQLWNGFTAPYPVFQGNLVADIYSEANHWYYIVDEEAPYHFECNVRSYSTDVMAEDPEIAKAWYAGDNLASQTATLMESEDIEIDGHPAQIFIYHVKSPVTEDCIGMIKYLRNNGLLYVRVLSIVQNETPWEDLPKVTMADMKLLASKIAYDPSRATVTQADGALSISSKGDPTVLTAGKKLQFSSAFAGPDKVKTVSKEYNAGAVEWSVTDPETGNAPEGITITAKGALSADKKLAEPKKVEVKASSPFFHTSAVYPLTVLPVVTKIYTDPAEVVFFAGTDATASVKPVLEPDTVPLTGITWSLKKEGIVQMDPGEGGAMTFKPLAAGKTTAVVSEPGGKKFTLKLSVVEPVTEVQLTYSGKPVPGGTVTVKAALTPKNAGIKDVKWVLVTGDDVATVNEKGQVKIAKDAPKGTLISVSCEALGAPEPVYGLTAFNVQ